MDKKSQCFGLHNCFVCAASFYYKWSKHVFRKIRSVNMIPSNIKYDITSYNAVKTIADQFASFCFSTAKVYHVHILFEQNADNYYHYRKLWTQGFNTSDIVCTPWKIQLMGEWLKTPMILEKEPYILNATYEYKCIYYINLMHGSNFIDINVFIKFDQQRNPLKRLNKFECVKVIVSLYKHSVFILSCVCRSSQSHKINLYSTASL